MVSPVIMNDGCWFGKKFTYELTSGNHLLRKYTLTVNLGSDTMKTVGWKI